MGLIDVLDISCQFLWNSFLEKTAKSFLCCMFYKRKCKVYLFQKYIKVTWYLNTNILLDILIALLGNISWVDFRLHASRINHLEPEITSDFDQFASGQGPSEVLFKFEWSWVWECFMQFSGAGCPIEESPVNVSYFQTRLRRFLLE